MATGMFSSIEGNKRRYLRRINSGICKACNRPAFNNSQLCKKHILKYRKESEKKRKIEKRLFGNSGISYIKSAIYKNDLRIKTLIEKGNMLQELLIKEKKRIVKAKEKKRNTQGFSPEHFKVVR